MKRKDDLFDELVSDENIGLAVDAVNATHRWIVGHRPNRTTVWVESTKEERVRELKSIILKGFVPHPLKRKQIYDVAAAKWRGICEPKQYPDQYVHHALIQVLKPIMMQGMIKWCCGSIRHRGVHYGMKAIKKWMKLDIKGTKYCMELDIRHFYDSINPKYVMNRMRRLIKDRRVLSLIETLISDGILIGYYFSQWFANTLLQPIDHMILESGSCKHYIRYMDNFTIFGNNKRNLRKLFERIRSELQGIGLEIKGNWQIFKTAKRMPNALGFRYGRGYTFIRKNNILRLRRKLGAAYRIADRGDKIRWKAAQGIVVRVSQLRHCNANHLRLRMVRQNFIKRMKNIIRKHKQQEELQWITVLQNYKMQKCFTASVA